MHALSRASIPRSQRDHRMKVLGHRCSAHRYRRIYHTHGAPPTLRCNSPPTDTMSVDWSKVDNPTHVLQRFASRRSVIYGTKGMVACSQPLAAEAGLEILRKGGNACDAA